MTIVNKLLFKEYILSLFKENQTTSDFVTAYGEDAASNNTGIRVTTIGYRSGLNNTGTSVTALGANSAANNTKNQLTAIGRQAARDNTGSNVTTLGHFSSIENMGNQVTSIGVESGVNNVGDDCIFLGYQSGLNNTISGQFIVEQRNVNTTPLIQGDFPSGNVGIGTTSPNSKLTVSGDVELRNNDAIAWGSAKSSRIEGNTASGNLSLFSNNSERVRIISNGNVGIGTTSPTSKLDINGSLSKNSGSFKIDHPLPALIDTHYLVHSFVEAPTADLVYSGMVQLVNGAATVDIDEAAGMTSGTFEALTTNARRHTSNESGFAAVRSTLSGSTLTIECEDATSTDTIFWQILAERADQHMMETEWTDKNGRVIVEPKK